MKVTKFYADEATKIIDKAVEEVAKYPNGRIAIGHMSNATQGVFIRYGKSAFALYSTQDLVWGQSTTQLLYLHQEMERRGIEHDVKYDFGDAINFEVEVETFAITPHKGGRSERFEMRLTTSDMTLLEQLATKLNVSKADVLSIAIQRLALNEPIEK